MDTNSSSRSLSSSSSEEDFQVGPIRAPASGPIRRSKKASRNPVPTVEEPSSDSQPKKSKNGKRLTNFCFTIFADAKLSHEEQKNWLEGLRTGWFRTSHGNPKFLVVGLEVCPKTQRYHLQGKFFELEKQN